MIFGSNRLLTTALNAKMNKSLAPMKFHYHDINYQYELTKGKIIEDGADINRLKCAFNDDKKMKY